ncbi:Nramp family divalent metal transporter [Microlunatus soli]|nr:Nramp family divalent metal transporter [Microlunatus soli]
MLGPALVAGIAYLDPGNVAANMTAGARYGFLLVWVVVLANLIAWLVQYLAAKLGLAADRSLADLLAERIRGRWPRRLYWLQAELVTMATDVAEVIGGAVALDLLFSLPLLVGGAITAVVSLLLLGIRSAGRQRFFERVIIGLLLMIVIGFTASLFVRPPSPTVVVGGLVPRLDGTGSLLLAASILGATVMPHAIYAHSALARDRYAGHNAPGSIRQTLRAARWDVTIALVIAGGVNLAILVSAGTLLRGQQGTDSLPGAFAAIREGAGPVIAMIFAIGLLASGLASTAVGGYAGGEVMQSLLRIRLGVLTRRLITAVPAMIILGAGLDPTKALVLSQVLLSFGIPFALLPLLWLTSQRSLMGRLRNRRPTMIAGGVSGLALTALNVVLIVLTL